MMRLFKNLQYQLYFIFCAGISIAVILFLTTLIGRPVIAVEVPVIIEEPIIEPPVVHEYIEVTHGCSLTLSESCALLRSGPSEAYKEVRKLRIGTVLKVDLTLISHGETWYRIVFDEWLRYPSRIAGRHYIRAADVHHFTDEGVVELNSSTSTATTSKYIIVDRSDQMLYAYEGEALFMTQPISTGLLLTPTPRGTFTIFKKTPTRYMQGPLPGIRSDYYDLPGVPWNLYFTQQGAVIHGAYWHDNFGKPWSHGCVNVPVGRAEKLYHWADIGMPVYVRD